MNNEAKELLALLENSQRVVVTSHISPDPDAVSSLLLMSDTLKLNYPDKTVTPVLEEQPVKLDFIPNFSSIKFQSIVDAVNELKPDLFIMLDGNNFDRVSRHDGAKVRRYIEDQRVKVIIIDHHEPVGQDRNDIYFNQNSAACVADVHAICFDLLGLKQPTNVAETTLVGLYADSGGFVYLNDGIHKKLFSLVNKLLDQGANVEKVKNQLNQFNSDDISVLCELFANISGENDYSYSFLSDEFITGWLKRGKTYPDIQLGTNTFLNEYLRNINGHKWGFMVYRNELQGENIYSVSLRSVAGVKDVAAIAKKLDGGGHKPAAGGKFEATNVNDAVNKVKQTIFSS